MTNFTTYVITDGLQKWSVQKSVCWIILSLLPHLFVPPESVHADFPLWTESGSCYVNSLPGKMLSKQIFREIQKEEAVNILKIKKTKQNSLLQCQLKS